MNKYEEDKLTDHEYDGIQEFDNKMPEWWLIGFYFTIAYGFLYILLFHVLEWAPLPEKEYVNELTTAYRKHNPEGYMKRMSGIAQTKQKERVFKLLTSPSDLAAGKKIFTGPKNLCFTCHGNEGQGLVGPNLTDDYWMHGYGVNTIMKNIKKGFPEKGMLPYGSNVRLVDTELNQLASYIISIRGSNPPNPKAIDPAREILLSEEEITAQQAN
jgi:cytochrome c oxidase cbb3-type subunit 3